MLAKERLPEVEVQYLLSGGMLRFATI